MAALPLNNEDLTLSTIKILETKTKDFTAAEPPKHHRFEHCTIPHPPTRSQQGVNLFRSHDPRQRPGSANQRHTPATPATGPASRKPQRHRIRINVATSD
jgi:hypothetical protein